MRRTIVNAVVIGGMGAAALVGGPRAAGQSARTDRPNPDSQYRLGPDSLPQEGVPKGEVRGPSQQLGPGTGGLAAWRRAGGDPVARLRSARTQWP